MSTDLRTELNDADATTGWTGDGGVSLNTTTGQRYEGSGAIQTQHSNSDEHLSTSSIGGTRNLSDATVYGLIKDNLVATKAGRGIQVVLDDGTNDIGFAVGGYDDVGLSLNPFYNAIKLDVTERATLGSNAYAGSAASLSVTAITSVGYGTVHLAKAVGVTDNCFVDRLAFHANGSYALRINGGTSGTPETMADVQGDDVSNGWGIISNPVGDQFQFFAPTEWGEPSANADAYFEASGEQWFWLGGEVGDGHFPFRVIGNATDTISYKLDTVLIVNAGQRAEFDLSDVNVDFLIIDSCTFTDLGEINFPAVSVTKRIDNCIFNTCKLVYANTVGCSFMTFNGADDANGALAIDSTCTTTDNKQDVTFNSDGDGHAVYITRPGTYNFYRWWFNDYGATGTTDAAIYNNSGGAVTINIFGGTVPTYRNGASATTTIQQTVTVRVRCIDAVTGDGIENVRVFLETDPGGVDVIDPATLTNFLGYVSVSWSGGMADVIGYARKGTESPTYKSAKIQGSIDVDGFDQVVAMTRDGA